MPKGQTNPFLSQSTGSSDTGSRGKAEQASKRAAEQAETASPDSWPRGVNGQPMMKVQMAASELIPTGQYANLAIGPAVITAYVDQDRRLEYDDEGAPKPYFSDEQRGTLAQALNELAEIVELDVIAVQRNLALESMQQDLENKS